ncbi:2'-5' RNA ligase family protein, partial [Paenibacillus macerans]|nr:2'-5' RNA ligase family protein [Paenibacillus macerans]
GRLHREVAEANRELGFVPEERRYSPHITLARKYREDAAAISAEALQEAAAFGSWTADRLVVYRTHMHERPMYETVATVSFSQ